MINYSITMRSVNSNLLEINQAKSRINQAKREGKNPDEADLNLVKTEGVWRIYDMQYNFEYTNLAKQNLIGLEAIMRWHFLNHFTMNATYSYVNVSKTDGIQVNTTSPHAATASLDYKYTKKNYRLGATFSASYMGEKKFDVQDRLSVNGESHDAYFRCQLLQYVLCNLSVIQTFYK